MIACIKQWRAEKTLKQLYIWRNREDAAYHRIRFSGLFGGKYGVHPLDEAIRDYEHAQRKARRLNDKFNRLTRGSSK